MADRKTVGHGQLPAVAYLRRSTSKQEKSLDDQRSEIERYAAANGYRIVRWYQDDGISGDATECRAGFLALHKTACNGRDFDVILVWDQDRFGRFDSMEAGYWIRRALRRERGRSRSWRQANRAKNAPTENCDPRRVVR